MPYRRVLHLLTIIIFTLVLTSCSLITKKGNWGDKALYPLHGSTFARAFKKNITSPHVWAPMTGAGVIFLTNQDRNISDWASGSGGLYDSQSDANSMSSKLDQYLKQEMYASTILTPSATEDGNISQYVFRKVKGSAVVFLASEMPLYVRDEIAKSTHRLRPNHSNHLSFPSGHGTIAGTRSTIISKNLDAMEMNSGLRTSIKTLNTSMAGVVLWNRVEAKRHYPSDVLVGYALGSFLGGVIYDALMNADENEHFTLMPIGDKVFAQYSYSF